MSLRQIIKKSLPPGILYRLVAWRAARRSYDFYFRRQVAMIHPTILASRETHNFTYDLTSRNLRYLAETVAGATGEPAATIEGYIAEAIGDRDLCELAAKGSPSSRPDLASPFGRRLGWYAIARVIKPRVIVETGVERGHGAIILCAALLRNAQEGHPGRYFGTDINPEAGWLLSGKYAQSSTMLYGDSITSLEKFNERIDLFVNDSDHSEDYEYREYKLVAPKLSPNAYILSDNAHVSDKLAIFARETGRHFLYFREEPANHWYPGAGLGIAFHKTTG